MLSKFLKATLVLAFGAMLFSFGSASAAIKPAAANPQVYCLRGLANIFSLGMDDLCSKITAAGIPAKVLNHSRWPSVADDIVAAYRANPKGTRPIVLIGHSLGANAVLVLAQRLGTEGVPVDLVVTFDPTVTGPVGSARRYLNIYESNDLWGVPLVEGKGVENSNIRFRKDINVGTINHMNIEKSDVLHRQVLAEVIKLAKIAPPKKKKPVKVPAAPAPMVN